MLGNSDDHYIPVFVTGAMRSGTTLLHALICTSPNTNNYIAECGYFTGLLHPLVIGLNNFDIHTRFYFHSKTELVLYHRGIVSQVLDGFWQRLGSPKILALKDPHMAPHMHIVMQLLPKSRFLVAVRDPRGVVASRISAERRQGVVVDDALLHACCSDYNNSYGILPLIMPHFSERICLVNYEALVGGDCLDTIKSFGIEDVDPTALWQDSITSTDLYKGLKFYSPLYGRPISNASIDEYKHILSEREQRIVIDRCGKTAQFLGIFI